MELSTAVTVLIALCPTISAVITAIIGFLSLIKTIKSLHTDNKETVGNNNQKIDRLERKLNTANNKLASIEQYLIEQKERLK